MAIKNYDIAVIGAGPGGYNAAIKCAELGSSVVCIDNFIFNNEYSLGGTCLNVGCIPSKALLQSSEHYEAAIHDFKQHGISCKEVSVDIDLMLKRKNDIIKKNSAGIEYLFKKNRVTYLKGSASFKERQPNQLEFTILIKQALNGSTNDDINNTDNGVQITEICAKHVIIATGSTPRQLTGLGVAVDNHTILDNQGALDIRRVPKNLGIIGAGVIGLELGSVWRRLGSKVTIFETSDKFLPFADQQVAATANKLYSSQGLNIKLNTEITSISSIKKNTQVSIKYKIKSDPNSTEEKLDFEQIIVAIGRIPNTSELNSSAVGLELAENGAIVVDQYCRSSVNNIWAIGDVVRGPMLAHKASNEALIVAEQIHQVNSTAVNFNCIPWVIYTDPEIAWVGKTEQELISLGIDYKSKIAHFSSNGRAMALGKTAGFVKVLANKSNDHILGVHIIGALASELITEAVVAMEFSANCEDLSYIIHAHPTLSEILYEACS